MITSDGTPGGWQEYKLAVTEFLRANEFVNPEFQAEFLLGAILDLESAVQNGTISKILESGRKPMVVLASDIATPEEAWPVTRKSGRA